MHVDRRRVRARRVLEAVDGVVADLVEQRDGVFEVAVGLAGKADDDVGGQRDVALRGLGPGNALEVPVAGVLALHGAEDVGRAGLHRQMHVVAERGHGVDGVDDVPGEVARVRGGEADALDAVDLADGGKKLGEAALAAGVAVAVDVLAEKLDFGEAKLRRCAGLRRAR